MDKVFFKIVIPNYNNVAYIRQCLDSILNQTFQDFKIIVVDDLSDDMSYEVAKMYERRHPDKVVVLRVPSKKYAGGCRNIGIDYSLESEYYYFIDSDDYLYDNNVLFKIKEKLLTKPDILLLNYSILKNDNLRQLSYNVFNRNSDTLAGTNWNASWTKVYKSSIIERFLENCMRGEDTYQWLKILDKNPKINQVDINAYVYRLHNKNTIYSDLFKQHNELYIQALRKLYNQVNDTYVKASINKRILSK